MAAKDHLNKELFHGSSDRFGVLKKGQLIVPGNEVEGLIDQHHQYFDYPEALNYAHATYSRGAAEIYANWAAECHKIENGKPTGVKPIVYSVKPAKNQEDDPYEWGAVRSTYGFEVIGRRRMRKVNLYDV